MGGRHITHTHTSVCGMSLGVEGADAIASKPATGDAVAPKGDGAGSVAPAKLLCLPADIEVGVPRNTTVYVGKIAASAEDALIRQVLAVCGSVKSWKRITDPETGKLKHFGFCEFADGLGCIRAMKLLDGLAIDGQAVLVKYNKATTKYIQALTSLSKARWIAEQRTKAALRSDISDGEIEDAMFDCVQGRKDVASLLGDHGSRPAAEAAREGGGAESRARSSGASQNPSTASTREVKSKSAGGLPSRRHKQQDDTDRKYAKILNDIETEQRTYLADRDARRDQEEAAWSERQKQCARDVDFGANGGGHDTKLDRSQRKRRRKEEKEDRRDREREQEEIAEIEKKASEAKIGFDLNAKGAKTQKQKNVFGGIDEEIRVPPLGKAVPQTHGLSLVDQVPTDREAILAYPYNWSLFPQFSALVQRWVVAKTVQLLGKEEKSLAEFVCSKLRDGTAPRALMDELEPILEEETEVFVLKLGMVCILQHLKRK